MKKLATILMISILVLSQIEPVKANEPVFFKLESIDLSEDLQEYIFEVAGDYHISPYLVFAIIERESQFDLEAIGDNGKSKGPMQVMEEYHKDRMKRLDVTDLLDPYQNILVGIDYLSELFHKNPDVYWVLMAYNGGIAYANKYNSSPSNYAKTVVDRSYVLEIEMHKNELIFRKTMFLDSRLNKGVVN